MEEYPHEFSRQPIRGNLLVRYLAGGREFRGVGLTKASALWNRFGESLYTILNEGDVRALSSVIDERLAADLITAWSEQSAQNEIVEWLDRHSFDARLAHKIIKIWGREAVRKLEENPYRMLAFAPWVSVDQAARNLGVYSNDCRRRIAAVEYACYSRLDAKHTLTPDDILSKSVRRILGCNEESAADAINLAAADRAIVKTAGGWQALGPAVMERYIADRLLALLNGTADGQGNLFWRNLSPRELNPLLSAFEAREGITLNPQQRDAARTALTEPVFVLTGGAGVGKTTTLKAVHEAAEVTGRRIIQMALSGRAARQLKDATGREAMTIAAFLGGAAKDSSFSTDESTLIIIDEASMLDLPLAYRILRAISPRACLMFVGDPYQLPPIGFGLVFHTLARHGSIPRVELSQVHRQAESTGIPEIANSIRTGQVPPLPRFSGSEPSVSFIHSTADGILDVLIDLAEAFGGFNDLQILAPTKQGSSGTNIINRVFHDLLSVGRQSLRGHTFAEGDPVIHLVNDYTKELNNGSLGVITTSHSGGGLVVDFGHIQEPLTYSLAKNLALAYAITVHKAQGSQFRRVAIPIARNALLDRTLIYTAVTRAVEQVVLVGEWDSFRRAVIDAPHAHLRRSGLSYALDAEV